MPFPPALLALVRCLILGTLLTPMGAAGQAPGWNWRSCGMGEPCWDRLIEQGDRAIQDKMREAQAAAARIRNADATARPRALAVPDVPARPADAAAAARAKSARERPPGVSADDMRFWSIDDCATRYDQSAGDREECVHFVTSDAAKQARIDRACHERHPADPEQYERCRLPLQSDATAASAAKALAAQTEATKAAAAPAPSATPALITARPAAEPPRGTAEPDPLAPVMGFLLSVVALALGAVAVRCWKPQLGWPQVVLASCMGLISGLMFYLLAALTIAGQSAPMSAMFALIAVIVGWVASVYLVLNGAISLARVVNRGFLLGVVEWMLMIPAGLFYASRAAAENMLHPGSTAYHGTMLFGTAIGGDLLAFFTGGIAVVMAGVCLVGFAVTYFISGQLEPQAPRAKRKCPECAEMIQAEASKCRYCNAVLKQPKAKVKGGPRTVTRTTTRAAAARPSR